MSTDTRERILDAAEGIARAKGLEAVSMRGIAEIVGLTAPAAYRHFRNKEELIEALLRRGYSGFIEGLDLELAGELDAEKRLRISLAYYMRFWDNDRDAFVMIHDRGLTRHGLSGASILDGSFGPLPEMTAAVLGTSVPEEKRLAVARWTCATLFGITISIVSDGGVPETVGIDRRIESAVDYLLGAIHAAAFGQR